LEWGIVGVAACYAAAAVAIEPVRAIITTRALGIPLWRFVGALTGVAQATLVMAVMVLGARGALLALGVPPAARLVLLIVLGAAVYLATCLWRAPEITGEIRTVLGRRRGGANRRAATLEARI
jgi:hypothetical protein